jgi:chromosome partitioning protein
VTNPHATATIDTPADDEPATTDPSVAPTRDAEPTDAASAGEPVIVTTEPPAPRPFHHEHRPRQTRIIAFMNQKGGVGKTTTCVNLGSALARLGFQVLLIDMDPQAHLTLHLGVDPEQLDATMYDLLTDADVTPISIAYQADDRLGVLPAEVNLAGVENELAPQMVTGRAQNILKHKCQEFVSHFDYVLIDCPPSLGLLTINALTLAREVVVPMQAHFLALQGLSKLLETVRMVRQGINPNLLVSGVVLCMHEGNTILAGEVVKDLKQFFEHGRGEDVPWRDAVLYQPPIRRNIKLAEAPSFGQPIYDYAPDCRGAEDYGRLARCIAQHRPAYAL